MARARQAKVKDGSSKELEKYPNLAKEIGGAGSIRITTVRTDLREAEKVAEDHGPSVIDFIRRCDTEEQAVEIIDFLESRNEINRAYAKKLKAQLARDGLRSFGPKRKPGFYYGQG